MCIGANHFTDMHSMLWKKQGPVQLAFYVQWTFLSQWRSSQLTKKDLEKLRFIYQFPGDTATIICFQSNRGIDQIDAERPILDNTKIRMMFMCDTDRKILGFRVIQNTNISDSGKIGLSIHQGPNQRTGNGIEMGSSSAFFLHKNTLLLQYNIDERELGCLAKIIPD